jgi:hypothetical protein
MRPVKIVRPHAAQRNCVQVQDEGVKSVDLVPDVRECEGEIDLRRGGDHFMELTYIPALKDPTTL